MEKKVDIVHVAEQRWREKSESLADCRLWKGGNSEMNKPLIIKCNLYNIRQDELMEIRKNIMKQMEDGVVILPTGFMIAEVNVELLNQIKKELQSGLRFDAEKMRSYLNSEDIERIFIKYIDELKGE